ncbi:DUF5359 family protein [Salirhabdus sp. Marseille-P4669]|uniref:DUF5359 family protein n=1 Tax=Salirhabdus sp. Marseille-P4669 TaxID=2042310 RepID=UPI00358F8886
MITLKKIEKIIRSLLIILLLLLILSQWLVLHTDIKTYVNPVYEYIGVFKPE